jgi:CrcB protein
VSDIFKSYLWVALGSALGGVGRFWISGLVAERLGKLFPWNTLLVNISGSFLIGLLAALSAPEGRMLTNCRPFSVHFLMIGVCGGYTTFSSFSLQTLSLLQDGEWFYASANAIASVICCMVAVWLGWFVGQTLNR